MYSAVKNKYNGNMRSEKLKILYVKRKSHLVLDDGVLSGLRNLYRDSALIENVDNAENALAVSKQQKFDLIIVESLQEKNEDSWKDSWAKTDSGLDLIRKIRKEGVNVNTPLVLRISDAATSEIENKLLEEGKPAGAQWVILRSEFDELHNIIGKAVKEKKFIEHAESEGGVKKPTILLVWDNNSMADHIISDFGKDVNFIRVKNSSEARLLLADKKIDKAYDGVVTQYSFRNDELNGVQLIENIRKSSQIPILLLSNTVGVIDKAKKAGATQASDPMDFAPKLSGFLDPIIREKNAAKILLVEGNENFAETLKTVGSRNINATYKRAATVEEANKLISENKFDAAIVADDVALKPKSRTDVIESLKAFDKNMPVAIYSYGGEHAADSTQIVDAEKDAYLKGAVSKGAKEINTAKPKEFHDFFKKVAASKEQFSPSFKAQPYKGI